MDSEATIPTQKAWSDRFALYFARAVAEQAAQSIAEGAEVEFQIGIAGSAEADEYFTFTRRSGKNLVRATKASDAHLTFKIPPESAETILSEPSEEIGVIGVGIAKLMVSPDANRRVTLKIHAGYMTLFTKGYFGVLTAGGTQFGSFLAARGLSGLRAIQSLLKKRNDS